MLNKAATKNKSTSPSSGLILISCLSSLLMLALSLYFSRSLVGAVAAAVDNWHDIPRNIPYSFIEIGEDMCHVAAFLLLAQMFYRSYREKTPFPKCAPSRLLCSGVLLASSLLLSTVAIQALLNSPKPPTMVIEPTLDVFETALAIFCVCLSLIFRYGNSVEKDSESII